MEQAGPCIFGSGRIFFSKAKIFVVTNNTSDESHLQTKIPRGQLIVVDSPRTDLRSRRVL
jgi:hypothetical protein